MLLFSCHGKFETVLFPVSSLCFLLFSVIYISCHLFNQTNLTERVSKADTEIEQPLSQLDNPIRESGVVSIEKIDTQWVLVSATIKWNGMAYLFRRQFDGLILAKAEFVRTLALSRPSDKVQ